jgi:hypothetical protein
VEGEPCFFISVAPRILGSWEFKAL